MYYLYIFILSDRLFDWLVGFINSSMCADDSKWCNFIGTQPLPPPSTSPPLCDVTCSGPCVAFVFKTPLVLFPGLLDVYGFECFLQNSLEQLCINYANEKLQQHFVAHYLKAQQEEYVSEGLQWSFIRYQDNQRCLELIEGNPTSIFSLLNEVNVHSSIVLAKIMDPIGLFLYSVLY